MSSDNFKFYVMAASLYKQLSAPEFFNLDFEKIQGALLHFVVLKLTKELMRRKKMTLLFPTNNAADVLKYMSEHAYGTDNDFYGCLCSKSELWKMIESEESYDWFKSVILKDKADEVLQKWADIISEYVSARREFPKSRKNPYIASLTVDAEHFGEACTLAFFCCQFLKTRKLDE